MEYISADKRLKTFATSRLSSLDVTEPYVWRLRLSSAEFAQLEKDIQDSIQFHEGSHVHLLTHEFARLSIVYLAEWYKRRYVSGTTPKVVEFDSSELKTLWQNSGINIGKFVYQSADGANLWQYSIYVLGGLAIRHELAKNDKGRFLKALCRLYHGEEYTLENLDEANRAIAFRESIKNRQSLYGFLKEILNGNLPFAEDDITSGESEVRLFIERIKAANDEVLKIKFRPEWVIRYSPEYSTMSRSLRLWLKPEDLDGNNHEYLRYDRVHLWGVPSPETQQHLRLSVEFAGSKGMIASSGLDTPLITYVNTGDPLTGFLAWGVNDYALCRNIPTNAFDTINVVVYDDAGNKYVAQTIDIADMLQVWRSDPYGDEWVSTTNSQKQTAVIFSSRWSIHLKSTSEVVDKKPFRDKKYGESENWGWYVIFDNVRLTNENGKDYTLYNRIGYDQISTKLYLNTIRYSGGGKVKHWYNEDPDITDELEYELLPLIFSKDDIIVQHFKTKDDILNACPESDTYAEKIEYLEGSRYQEWNDYNIPAYGKNKLRVTIKGRPFPYEVCLLPSASSEYPVIRDFGETSVVYAVSNELGEKEVKRYKDNIVWGNTPLEPVNTFRVGASDDYVELEVYRPILDKGAILDGKVIKVLKNGEEISVPYILKKQFVLQDFSEEGYREYNGVQLNSLFSEPFINIGGNPNTGAAALAAWTYNRGYRAKLLDALAPEYLIVVFGSSRESQFADNAPYYFWSYNEYDDPVQISKEEIESYRGRCGIIFQDASKASDIPYMMPIEYWDVWEGDYNAVSIVKCFEIAVKYNLYFFSMQHLRELAAPEYIPRLYEALFHSRGGKLTDADIDGLLRFQDEFGFRWEDKGISICE